MNLPSRLTLPKAIFKLLVDAEVPKHCPSDRGLIITGKGYPDFATRAFLRYCVNRLATTCQNRSKPLPVFGLFDCNPDGLLIYKIYHSGAWAFTDHTSDCTVAEIQLLGLCLDQIPLDMYNDSLQKLSPRDRKKAVDMLRNGDVHSDSEFQMALVQKLQTVIMLGYKAELEVLEKAAGGIAGWTRRMISQEVLA